jgi:predicted transposase YbfD/YdcC
MLELKALMEIEDKRRGQGRMYDLAHVVFCCIAAAASGADSCVWGVAQEWSQEPVWPQIRCVIEVLRSTAVFDTRSGQWGHRGESAWYVSTRQLSAQEAHDVIRAHWQVENGLHHVRDVSLGKDASQIRKEPGVFAQLRTLALNLLRQMGHDNIKAARQIMSWSEQALLELIGKMQR